MAVYTKKGDKGETSLLGGSRVSKNSLQVSCYGTIDEANAILGVAYSLVTKDVLKDHIRMIQKLLFAVGAELANDNEGRQTLVKRVEIEDIENLEEIVDAVERDLGPLNEFIIPGETTASAMLHQARAVIRRAERLIIDLDKNTPVRLELKQYINRLSDTLFMLARMEPTFHFLDEVKQKVMEKIKGNKNDKNVLNLRIAKQMAAEAEDYATQINAPIVFTAVDKHGNLILTHRMEGSLLGSIDISKNKAFSAVALQMGTDEIGKVSQPGEELYGIQLSNQNRIVSFGGGFPLNSEGEIVGGIGVSGGSVDEDVEIASKAQAIFEKGRGENNE